MASYESDKHTTALRQIITVNSDVRCDWTVACSEWELVALERMTDANCVCGKPTEWHYWIVNTKTRRLVNLQWTCVRLLFSFNPKLKEDVSNARDKEREKLRNSKTLPPTNSTVHSTDNTINNNNNNNNNTDTPIKPVVQKRRRVKDDDFEDIEYTPPLRQSKPRIKKTVVSEGDDDYEPGDERESPLTSKIRKMKKNEWQSNNNTKCDLLPLLEHHFPNMSQWEQSFVRSLTKQRSGMSDRQTQTLNGLIDKYIEIKKEKM